MIVAVVGENGSGKTTLVKLINRLYEPSFGSIQVNGQDIRDISILSFRKKMTAIFQHFSRYNASVIENIQYADVFQTVNRNNIESAAKDAMATGFIEKLPLKFDTQLGRSFRHGEELSGGQWQKIALARAYMKDAQLLILDEPTAALDARAEHEVFQRFSELIEGFK